MGYTPSVTCPNNTACTQYMCNPATGVCDVTTTVCNDTDICTVDTCDPVVGCVYTNRTQASINSLCSPAQCKVAACVRGSNACSFSSDPSASCACQEYPCTNNATFCTTPQCVSTAAGCMALATTAEQAACNASLVSVPRRYCADIPTNPCPTSTACLTYTCNATAGGCDVTDVGAACTSDDICKKPSCNPATGCLEVDKTAAEIAAVCNDNNACTIDTCANNTCIYTPRVCPTPSDQCAEAFCNPTSGCGTRQKNATAIAALCNDNNLCTTDSCSSNACVYTVTTTCPSDNACSAYVCNATTGVCDETRTVCNDGDQCTIDTCNTATGCVYTPLSQPAVDALCNPGNCQLATCAVGSNNCTIVADLSPSCACLSNPCTNNATFCTTPLCVSYASVSPGQTSCQDLPAGARANCTDAVTNGATKRFCYDLPRTGVCKPNNLCSNFTCVNSRADPATGFCAEDTWAAACTEIRASMCRFRTSAPSQSAFWTLHRPMGTRVTT